MTLLPAHHCPLKALSAIGTALMSSPTPLPALSHRTPLRGDHPPGWRPLHVAGTTATISLGVLWPGCCNASCATAELAKRLIDLLQASAVTTLLASAFSRSSFVRGLGHVKVTVKECQKVKVAPDRHQLFICSRGCGGWMVVAWRTCAFSSID